MRDRTPVIVGVAQRTWRATADALAPEPARMIAEVLRAAAADAGAERLLARATGLWIVDVASWPYGDAPAAVAKELGIEPAHTLTSALGGEQPQVLFGRAAEAVARGEHDVVLVAGAEAFRTRRLSGLPMPSLGGQGSNNADLRAEFKVDRDPTHPAEAAVGLRVPTDYYPLFETALRGAAGRTIAEHRESMGRLWADFAQIAAANPHAVLRTAPDAEQIASPSDRNRMIAFPYTKLLTANIAVDMAAAAVFCSAEVASELGIAYDHWVFPLAAASAADTWFVSDRDRLDRSPAIRANAAAVFAATGTGIDDVAHLDLYSCFPSAVQIAAGELGLSLDGDRPLTCTGGLTFAGGPSSNYSTHGLASLVERLRADAGSLGLLTANGMFSTKHALGLYSNRPRGEFVHAELGTVASATRPTHADFAGDASLETYVVRHGADGQPLDAILAGIAADGARVWTNSTDDALLDRLERDELLGERLRFG
ncbi:MAG: acetyl-CoA acetyltransferase [Sporichthyaceae bacterium]